MIELLPAHVFVLVVYIIITAFLAHEVIHDRQEVFLAYLCLGVGAALALGMML